MYDGIAKNLGIGLCHWCPRQLTIAGATKQHANMSGTTTIYSKPSRRSTLSELPWRTKIMKQRIDVFRNWSSRKSIKRHVVRDIKRWTSRISRVDGRIDLDDGQAPGTVPFNHVRGTPWWFGGKYVWNRLYPEISCLGFYNINTICIMYLLIWQ